MLNNIYAKIVKAKNPVALPDGLVEAMSEWVANTFIEQLRDVHHKHIMPDDYYPSFCMGNGHKVFNTTNPYSGEPIEITLAFAYMGKSNLGSNYPFAGGKFVRTLDTPGRRYVAIIPNKKFKYFGRNRSSGIAYQDMDKIRAIVLEQANLIIFHELTHHIDDLIKPLPFTFKEPTQFEYANSPSEVKAFGRNIFEMAKRNAEKDYKKYKGRDMNAHAHALLDKIQNKKIDGIDGWVINPGLFYHLNQNNERTMVKLFFSGYTTGWESNEK